MSEQGNNDSNSFPVQVLENKYMRQQVQTPEGERWLYKYEMFANTVDLVVFDHNLLYAMLVKRGSNTEPEQYRGCWAIPGGFLNKDETSEQGAVREFNEETGETVDPKDLHFVCVADNPTRDPRQRTVGLVYTAIATMTDKNLVPVDVGEIDGVKWISIKELVSDGRPMAFDHDELLFKALQCHIE